MLPHNPPHTHTLQNVTETSLERVILLLFPFILCFLLFICCFEGMLGRGSEASAFSANHIAFSKQPQSVLQVQDPVVHLHSIIRLPIHSIPVFRPPAYLARQTTDNIHKHAADRTKTGDSRKRHLQRQIAVGVCHKAGWVVVDWVDRGFYFIFFKGVQGKPKVSAALQMFVHYLEQTCR